jgi:glycosyltransferase involved in cell wall biosynthesis
MFAADSIANRRKGGKLLHQAMQHLKTMDGFLALVVGAGAWEPSGDLPWLHLGSLNHDRLLTLAYSAADVFVIPSLQDNLPNTVLESMACGAPVVGFAVGGIPDMVDPGKTGLLVAAGDSHRLSDAIREVLLDRELRAQMSNNARSIAVVRFSLGIQARRYLAIYRNLLAI